MSAGEDQQPEQQQHPLVYRSYQSFRFPFSTDRATVPDTASSTQSTPRPATTDDSHPAAPEPVPSPPPVPVEVPPPVSNNQAAVVPPLSASSVEAAATSATATAVENTNTPRVAEESASPVGAARSSQSPRASDSPSVNRAPPRALARRASMVSFRGVTRNASFGGESVKSENTPPPSQGQSPRQPAQDTTAPSDPTQTAVVPTAQVSEPQPPTPRQPPSVQEPVVVAAPAGGPTEEPARLPEALPGVTSGSRQSSVEMRTDESSPPAAASYLGKPAVVSPRGVSSPATQQAAQPSIPALYLTPTAVASEPRDAASVGVSAITTRTPSVDPSYNVVEPVALQSPPPSSSVQQQPPIAKVATPVERHATPKEATLPPTPSNSERSIAPPVVPKRAGPSVVAKFQAVVRQKLEQERRATADAAKQQQEAADRTKVELLMELRQAEMDERKNLEAERRKLQEERALWDRERNEMEQQREKIRVELGELKKLRFSMSVKAISSPAAGPWRGDSCVVSPNREDFKRIDPMVLRTLLQGSPHGGAFHYEAPAQVPSLLTTAREASESRDTAPTLEQSTRAQVLRHFDGWKEPPRYKASVLGPSLQIEDRRHLSRSPNRAASPSASSIVGANRGQSPKRLAEDDEYLDVDHTPTFRLFPKRR